MAFRMVYLGWIQLTTFTYALSPDVGFMNHFSVFAFSNGFLRLQPGLKKYEWRRRDLFRAKLSLTCNSGVLGAPKNATHPDQSNCLRSDSGMFPARK
jgi:hypothetical protein